MKTIFEDLVEGIGYGAIFILLCCILNLVINKI